MDCQHFFRQLLGWISSSAEKLGSLQEQGGKTMITSKMRKMFAAAGIPLSGKVELRIPKRPTIQPEYRAKAPEIPVYVEGKIMEYLRKAER